MIRWRVFPLLVVSAMLWCAPQLASAQTPYSYAWCSTNGGGDNCYYATLEQCVATTWGGRGGRCVQSPYYRAPAAALARSQAAAVPRAAEHAVRPSRAAAGSNAARTQGAQSTGAAYAASSDLLVAQDYAAVLTAAEQGDATAQYNLAVMYDSGRGVLQDYVQAHKWYNLAAVRFSSWEADIGASAVTNRDRLTARMTPSQLAEAQKMAREWEPRQGR